MLNARPAVGGDFERLEEIQLGTIESGIVGAGVRVYLPDAWVEAMRAGDTSPMFSTPCTLYTPDGEAHDQPFGATLSLSGKSNEIRVLREGREVGAEKVRRHRVDDTLFHISVLTGLLDVPAGTRIHGECLLPVSMADTVAVRPVVFTMKLVPGILPIASVDLR